MQDFDLFIDLNEHGRPKLKGRRLRVQDVAIAYSVWGWPFARIADEYQLEAEQVETAWNYYLEHSDQIIADIKADIELANQLPRLTDLLDDEPEE